MVALSDEEKEVPKTDEQKQREADDAIVQHAKDLYETDKTHWDPIYDKAREDLRFLSDEPGAQWLDQEYAKRTKSGRTALTIDMLNQFVHQVANNIRMKEPSINVIPDGNEATIETAKIFKGLIKKIEYNSSADEVYDTAATSAVKCSIGYIRIDHDYIDETSFNQELKIKRVINPFLIFPDSTFIESDGRDQNRCTILDKMKARDFKRKYPLAAVISFDSSDKNQNLKDEDDVTIAEFFIKSTEESTLTAPEDPKKTRTVRKFTIMRYKLSGADVLERSTFPGDYVPIVPVVGEEAWEDGVRHLHSLIRKSKQAQMQFNIMQSIKVDVLMKQPNASVMVPAGAIENYKDDWIDPSKSMALRYDTHDGEGNPLPPPTRLEPPQMSSGIIEAANSSIDHIKGTLGLYNQALGEQGNETSGVAINARKIQGDVATYHFGDNLVRSITQVGRILVCAAAAVYDVGRIIGILNEEDDSELVGINGLTVEGQTALHDFSKGKYDVRVLTGASYATKRQESEAFLTDIIKGNPQMMNVVGDLLFKYSDVAGAEVIAARVKKMIPPQILAGEDGQQAPDPQVAQLTQQLEQAKQLIQAGAAEMQKMQQKLDDKTQELQIKAAAVSSKHETAGNNSMLKVGELAIKDRALDIEEQKNAGELALSAMGQKIDLVMQMMQRFEKQLPQGNTAAGNGAVNPQGVTQNV